jgi:3-deoxy-D-manno-octulosonic-acid transferase
MWALRLYQLIAFLAAPFISLSLRQRAKKGREVAARLGERKGIASRPRPDGKVIWLHAASVGETYSVLPLIEDIFAADAQLHIVLTTGTKTSAEIVARERLKDSDKKLARLIHQFAPLDRRAWIAGFLAHWKPSLAGWAESEIWPNWVLACEAQNIDLLIINGRLSARSFARWQKIPGAAKYLLSRFCLLMAQDETTAQRLTSLGLDNVATPGNLKLDAPALAGNETEIATLRAAFGKRPVWLASSTHEGEEVAIAATHHLLLDDFPDLLTLIAPRHPNRGDGLAAELQALLPAHGVLAQRSRGGTVSDKTQIYLLDTLGELGVFYRLADIVFMGGSLVPHGGQNPTEAARLDCALLHGPHIGNFTEIYDALHASGGANLVADSATLAAEVKTLLANPAAQKAVAAQAAAYVGEMSGTRQRVVALLRPYWEGDDG